MILHIPDFRSLAHQSVQRAKNELLASDPTRLRYAALELRDAMEALTYDRALAFKDDLPPEEYKTWQPRKLMEKLLEIDPSIGMSATIAFGEETEYGKAPPPMKMHVLGTDVPISMKNLKDHYNALASYLHMPSLEQALTGKLPDPAKLRDRCEDVVAIIDKVLSCPVWNSTLGIRATLPECMNEACKQPIKRRLPFGKTELETRCFACDAEYIVTWGADHNVLWTPKQVCANCANPDCRKDFPLWPHEAKPGTRWRCQGCNKLNALFLGIRIQDEQPANKSS